MIGRKADTALVSGQEAVLTNKKVQATLLLIAFELPHFASVMFLFPEDLFWLYQGYHIIYSVEYTVN